MSTDNKKYIINLLIPIFIGIIIWCIPVPKNVDPRGWHLLAIFIATISGAILKPLPMGPVSLIGLLVATLAGCLKMATDSLITLSSTLIWLVVFVFMIAKGFVKTNLGSRIAYTFVKLLGKRTLGLGYGIVFSELIMAPLIPSNSARAGGVLYPIVKSIAQALGSNPTDGTQKRLGEFLTLVTFHVNIITSAMFITAMAANPLAQSIAARYGVTITWIGWAKAAALPGIISLILIPLIIYFISPPELKTIPKAESIAKEHLHQMGKINHKEWIMISVFVLLLALWMFGSHFGIDACTAALCGLCVLLITRVLNWSDLLAEHEAWHTLIWLTTLITMSIFLQKYGVVDWFSASIAIFVKQFPPLLGFTILAFIYFYSHYFFAGNTAHASSMYGSFIGVASAIGIRPMISALVFGFFNSLFSSMTHYGTTTSPILFGYGYVSLKKWWAIGFLISIVNFVIWLGIGSLWWKALGIW